MVLEEVIGFDPNFNPIGPLLIEKKRWHIDNTARIFINLNNLLII